MVVAARILATVSPGATRELVLSFVRVAQLDEVPAGVRVGARDVAQRAA